jgi:glycosyltransferase involved in cell wall biosynthesis
MIERRVPGLRVVQLIDGLRVGGAERLVVQAATELVARGAVVSVVVLDGSHRSAGHLDELARAGVDVRFLPALTRPALADPGRVGRLAQTFHELGADVVQSHLTYANILGGLAARQAGLPLIGTLHNSSAPPGARDQALRRVEAAVLDRCAALVVAVGPTVLAANQHRFHRVALAELTNPVALPDPVTPEARGTLRAELLGDSAGPLMLGVGRLSPQKAFGDLIDAAGRAAASLPGLVVAIAGEGADRPELEARIEAAGLGRVVRLLGLRTDIGPLMAAADALVMSSHWEGLPLVVLEAMVRGLPVVATEVGDVPSVLRAPDGETLGVLVPPGRPERIASALVDIAAGGVELAARTERARLQVERTASIEVWSDRLADLLARHATHPVTDRPLKVAVLSHGYWPRLGGIERQRAIITPRLRAAGIDARVVCRRDTDTIPFDLVGGVPVHRVAAPGPKALASVSYTAAALARLLWFRPDVIHAHEFHSTARVGLWAARLLGCPLVVSAHRSGPLGDVQRQGRRPSGRLRRRRLLQRADLLVAVSEEIEAEMLAAGATPERIAVIGNGVDTTRFSPLDPATRHALRTAWGWDDDEVVTVFIGRVAPEKRVGMLIEAWRDAQRALATSGTLVIAGDGPERAVLETAWADDRVRWMGVLDDPADLLACADVFVLPSVAEGLSNALLEAAASGLAIVVSDVGGARDVIGDGESGVLVAPDDPGALADGLKMVLGDAEERVRLGRGARDGVVDRFGVERIAARFAASYRELAGRPARTRWPVGERS